MRKELTKTFYDDLKLKKNNFWSPEFGQKYFSVVKSYCALSIANHGEYMDK